ncbi:MAG: hypothetical protein LBQ43_00215 [Holosporales bacterium]|jgi:hypothetical protein|nr:hypothetical protein [Holosporales bacterium]
MLNKSKFCAFGFASCLWGCSQAFSIDHWPSNLMREVEQFVKEGDTPIDKCLRFFIAPISPSDFRSVYPRLACDLLKVRGKTIAISEDARALAGFLDQVLRGQTLGDNGAHAPFIFNIFKYVLLSLGSQYEPNCAAAYISELSPAIETLKDADCNNSTRSGHPVVPIELALKIVELIDSNEVLSAEDKLSAVEFFLMSRSGDIAVSLSIDPNGDFEKFLRKSRKPFDFSSKGRKDFEVLIQNPRIRAFFETLKEELHQYTTDELGLTACGMLRH